MYQVILETIFKLFLQASNVAKIEFMIEVIHIEEMYCISINLQPSFINTAWITSIYTATINMKWRGLQASKGKAVNTSNVKNVSCTVYNNLKLLRSLFKIHAYVVVGSFIKV